MGIGHRVKSVNICLRLIHHVCILISWHVQLAKDFLHLLSLRLVVFANLSIKCKNRLHNNCYTDFKKYIYKKQTACNSPSEAYNILFCHCVCGAAFCDRKPVLVYWRWRCLYYCCGVSCMQINNPDMRVVILKNYAKEHFPSTPLIDYAVQVEQITTSKVHLVIWQHHSLEMLMEDFSATHSVDYFVLSVRKLWQLQYIFDCLCAMWSIEMDSYFS